MDSPLATLWLSWCFKDEMEIAWENWSLMIHDITLIPVNYLFIALRMLYWTPNLRWISKDQLRDYVQTEALPILEFASKFYQKAEGLDIDSKTLFSLFVNNCFSWEKAILSAWAASTTNYDFFHIASFIRTFKDRVPPRTPAATIGSVNQQHGELGKDGGWQDASGNWHYTKTNLSSRTPASSSKPTPKPTPAPTPSSESSHSKEQKDPPFRKPKKADPPSESELSQKPRTRWCGYCKSYGHVWITCPDFREVASKDEKMKDAVEFCDKLYKIRRDLYEKRGEQPRQREYRGRRQNDKPKPVNRVQHHEGNDGDSSSSDGALNE
jgi:hypothetical protein